MAPESRLRGAAGAGPGAPGSRERLQRWGLGAQQVDPQPQQRLSVRPGARRPAHGAPATAAGAGAAGAGAAVVGEVGGRTPAGEAGEGGGREQAPLGDPARPSILD